MITDPSYAGQIITFTNPHIGNYGVNRRDFESVRPFCRGVIVREMARRHSNHRAQAGLDDDAARATASAASAGIDTRRLTRLLRDTGAMAGAFGTAVEAELRAAAAAEPGTDGVDLVAEVTTDEPYTVARRQPVGATRRASSPTTSASSTRSCASSSGSARCTSCRPRRRPPTCWRLSPDGVFLSNGPGDPAEVPYAVEAIGGLLGNVPVFGICLGHQLLGRALGGETFKLPFGHHGGNHPVRNESTGHVEITSQNHNFCVAADSLAGVADVTHVNLNDGTNEGMRVRGAQAFSVQYHPEAGPGPHDSRYLFADFAALMDGRPLDKLPPVPGAPARAARAGLRPGLRSV